MHLGLLQFELLIHDAGSLKEKRRVVRSVRDRLVRRFSVSVAETGLQDVHQAAQMGVSVVSGDPRQASKVLDRVIDDVRLQTDAELGDVIREVIDTDSMRDSFLGEDGLPLWTEQERREPVLPEDDE